jgi:hypothetical protein
MTDETYHRWPLAKMRFTKEQSLLPSLQGKEIEGSGVAIDYLGQEHVGAVGITATEKNVQPVAIWDDGTMAIADVRAGRGRFILLGTPFYLRMKDVAGVWVNDERRGAWLDEFLAALGVPRDSWASGVWAEAWRSKNGVYDLYPVARMTSQGDPSVSAAPVLRRDSAPAGVVEISALGHPKVAADWKAGKLTLPAAGYGPMQTRVYAAPRADIAHGALDWFATQAGIWRALPPLPEERVPRPVAVPGDLLPLPDGWTLKINGQPDRTVRLGAFATLGLPEETAATFAKTVPVPAAWKGRRVELTFNAEGWFWGILPQGRLRINGQEAAVKQPIAPAGAPGFTVDVTDAAAAGTLAIELDIDGVTQSMMRRDKAGLAKPHGVTGIFVLQATPPAVKTQPLDKWQVASGFNRLQPAPAGRVKTAYLETRFTLPKSWPAARLFLESPSPLGFLVLNGTVLGTPAWMRRLDVSGLIVRDGENVLRWVPASRDVAWWNRTYDGPIPALNLVWSE